MQEKIDKISNLIDKHLKEELSEVERQELDIWLSESEQNRNWFDQISNREVLTQKLVEFSGTNKEAVWQKTVSRINKNGEVIRMVPLIKMYAKKAFWIKLTSAAAAAVVLTGSIWLYVKQNKNESKEVVHTPVAPKQLDDKVVPGGNKAILILADNSTITLGKEENREVARQGNIIATANNGQLIYKQEGTGTVEQATTFNRVITPNGGMYLVVLPDGSKVWLNAASSLRFPIAFAGNERRIQLTGEAYFEVEHLSSGGQNIPFKVDIIKSGKISGLVEVFGTHFNIMAYDDETTVQATLLSGSVKVSNANEQNKGRFIKPGYQGQIENDRIEVRKVDAERAASWKDGFFPAENLQTIIRQIARWYDVKVVTDGASIPEVNLAGKIPRTLSFDGLLKALEMYKVQSKQDGRTLIIK